MTVVEETEAHKLDAPPPPVFLYQDVVLSTEHETVPLLLSASEQVDVRRQQGHRSAVSVHPRDTFRADVRKRDRKRALIPPYRRVHIHQDAARRRPVPTPNGAKEAGSSS